MKNSKEFLHNPGLQTLLISLLCIVLGLAAGLVALMIINPNMAIDGILSVIRNFLNTDDVTLQKEQLALTIVKTVPLLMCGLSVLFAYKAGLFNIGAAGQYMVGVGACLYCALSLHLPWYVSFLAAIAVGALWGAISGTLKALCNVNEVISSIMLNWIGLYLVNMLLDPVMNPTGKDTYQIVSYQTAETYLFNRLPAEIKTAGITASSDSGISAKLPSLGLESWFCSNSQYVTIAIPLAILVAVLIWFILQKTKLGYELKATGYNRSAAKYCGMREKKNLILTMTIAGALAGCGAAMYYLTNVEQYSPKSSSVLPMGFNGIAAAFLGGLNPLGTVFSSYFIQHILDGGSRQLTTMDFPKEVCDLVLSLIIFLCGFVLYFKEILNKGLEKWESYAIGRKYIRGARILFFASLAIFALVGLYWLMGVSFILTLILIILAIVFRKRISKVGLIAAYLILACVGSIYLFRNDSLLAGIGIYAAFIFGGQIICSIVHGIGVVIEKRKSADQEDGENGNAISAAPESGKKEQESADSALEQDSVKGGKKS